jgi:hypothetical protein
MAYAEVRIPPRRRTVSPSVAEAFAKRCQEVIQAVLSKVEEGRVESQAHNASNDCVVRIRSRNKHPPRGLPSGVTCVIDPRAEASPCCLQFVVECHTTQPLWKGKACFYICSAGALLCLLAIPLLLMVSRHQ